MPAKNHNQFRAKTPIHTARYKATEDRHHIDDHAEKTDLCNRPVKHRCRVSCAQGNNGINTILIDHPGNQKSCKAGALAYLAQCCLQL